MMHEEHELNTTVVSGQGRRGNCPRCLFEHRGKSALLCEMNEMNNLGREGGRSDIAATFVEVAATSLRPNCDLNFLLGIRGEIFRGWR